MSNTELAKKFRANPKVHPETGKRLMKGKGPYNELVALYGDPELPLKVDESPVPVVEIDPDYALFVKKRHQYDEQNNRNIWGLFQMMSDMAGAGIPSRQFDEQFPLVLGSLYPEFKAAQKLLNNVPTINQKVLSEQWDMGKPLPYSPDVDYRRLIKQIDQQLSRQARSNCAIDAMKLILGEAQERKELLSKFDLEKLKHISEYAATCNGDSTRLAEPVYHVYSNGAIKGYGEESNIFPPLPEYSSGVIVKFPFGDKNDLTFFKSTRFHTEKIRELMIEAIYQTD